MYCSVFPAQIWSSDGQCQEPSPGAQPQQDVIDTVLSLHCKGSSTAAPSGLRSSTGDCVGVLSLTSGLRIGLHNCKLLGMQQAVGRPAGHGVSREAIHVCGEILAKSTCTSSQADHGTGLHACTLGDALLLHAQARQTCGGRSCQRYPGTAGSADVSVCTDKALRTCHAVCGDCWQTSR